MKKIDCSSIYRAIIPQRIREKLYLPKMYILEHKKYKRDREWFEREKSCGKNNPTVRFFVIRKRNEATGLLSCYLSALGLLKHIEGQGYTPIIDMYMHKYDLIHRQSDKAGNVNAWDYYFEQLSDYQMCDVLKSKNVHFSASFCNEGNCFFDNTRIDRTFISKWSELDRTYFKLRNDMLIQFENTRISILNGKRVLGTMIREAYIILAEGRDKGSDLYLQHPGIQNHPVQPKVEELICSLEYKMKEWDCDYVFAVFETDYVGEKLAEHFGNKLIMTNRNRMSVSKLSIEEYYNAIEMQNTNDRVTENRKYLEEVYILSKCTSLYASKCSGSIVASLWNRNEYENIEITQYGLY